MFQGYGIVDILWRMYDSEDMIYMLGFLYLLTHARARTHAHAHAHHTFASDEQGELAGVGLAAGLYKHDHLVMRVFRNVSTVDQHHQVSLQQLWLASPRLQAHMMTFDL